MGDFGRRLENLRDKTDYTKKEISLKLGFSPNVYGAYEREERGPSIETMIKLADLFDVSLDYLIRGEEYQQINSSEHIIQADPSHLKNGNQQLNEEALQQILKILKEKDFDYSYLLQPDKWSVLSEEDIRELSNHFEWVYEKAKIRNENK